jgi:hypothetical protein
VSLRTASPDLDKDSRKVAAIAASEHDELLGVRPKSRAHPDEEADLHRLAVIRLTALGVLSMLCVAAAYVIYCPCLGPLRLASTPRVMLPGGLVLRTETLEGGAAWRVRAFDASERQLVWGEVLDLWRSSPEFALEFQRTLARSPHAAFHWETPPLSLASRSTAVFECVTLPAPHLEGIASDPRVFATHIGGALQGSGRAVSFPNLGGDATLVSPCEDARAVSTRDLGAYSQLAQFARHASAEQAVVFWRATAKAVDDLIARGAAAKPIWVSTEGSGVAWLHVRLDARPKYFHWSKYAAPPS